MLIPSAAWAQVSVNPDTASQGGFATLSFQVPNETEDAITTQVEVDFPTDAPIPFVSVQPVPGWTADITRAPLPEPVEMEDGDTIDEAVTKIVWTGGEIKPDEFQAFTVSAGPIPKTDQLVFKAIQTYDKAEPVRWIEETPASGEEPEHPAPVLTPTPSTGEGAYGGVGEDTGDDASASAADSDDGDDSDSNGLAIAALVVGGVGVILGGVALARSGRKAPAA